MTHYEQNLTPRRRVNNLFEPWTSNSANKQSNTLRANGYTQNMHHKAFIECLESKKNSASVPRHMLHLPTYLSPRPVTTNNATATISSTNYRPTMNTNKLRPSTVPCRKSEQSLLQSLLCNIDKFITCEKNDKSEPNTLLDAGQTDRFNIKQNVRKPKTLNDDIRKNRNKYCTDQTMKDSQTRYVTWKDFGISKLPPVIQENSSGKTQNEDVCLQSFLIKRQNVQHCSVKNSFNKLITNSCERVLVGSSKIITESSGLNSVCKESKEENSTTEKVDCEKNPKTVYVPNLKLSSSSEDLLFKEYQNPVENTKKVVRHKSNIRNIFTRKSNMYEGGDSDEIQQKSRKPVAVHPIYGRVTKGFSHKKQQRVPLCQECRIRRVHDFEDSEHWQYSDDETDRRKQFLCRNRSTKRAQKCGNNSSNTLTRGKPSPVSGSTSTKGETSATSSRDKITEISSIQTRPDPCGVSLEKKLCALNLHETDSDDWAASEEELCPNAPLVLPRETRTATLLMLDDRGRAEAKRRAQQKLSKHDKLNQAQTQLPPSHFRSEPKTCISINVNGRGGGLSSNASCSCHSIESVLGLCPFNLLCDGQNCEHMSASDVSRAPSTNITYPSYNTALSKFRGGDKERPNN